MFKHFWPVTRADVKRGSWDSHCGYCEAKLGTEHRPKCSIRQRTVVVELDHEVELIAWFPEAWPLEIVGVYYQGGVDPNLALLCPGLDGHRPASQSMIVTNLREATAEDEESLPEWPA